MFVRMVSHEIRTPLNAVSMGLHMLKDELESHNCSEEALETWADVKSSCGIAVEILDDLLLYEKLEAGIMTLEKEEMLVWQFLNKAVQPFRLQVNIIYFFLNYIL